MVPHAIVRLLQPKVSTDRRDKSGGKTSALTMDQSFLRFISLLTATEFITITLLINKVSGLYGILALFTGFQLSALQLSMYLYSIAVFALVCYLGPHIRKQTALHNLLLAWVYIFDTVINVTYTALFGLAWFITLAQHLDEDGGDQTLIPPGSELMNDTAGFTDPSAGKVDKVEVVAQPSPGTFPPGQDAKAYAFGDGNELGGALFDTGSLMSVTVICTLWLLRLYLVIIVMSYARSVLRQTMVSNAYTFQDRPRSKGSRPALSDTPTTAVESTSAADRFAQVGAKEGHGHTSRPRHLERLQNPFGASLPDGQGWGGRIGRLLSSFPRSYWLGNLSVVPELDDMQPEWARATEARFEHQRDHAARDSALPILKAPVPPTPVGTLERERRARRGTGPPPPGLDTTSPGQARSSEEIAPDEIRSAHG